MQLHLREKQELFEANSALRTALRRRGLGDAALEAELQHINMQVWACCGWACWVLSHLGLLWRAFCCWGRNEGQAKAAVV